MCQFIDIYNDARRKLNPMDSLRYTLVDSVYQNLSLNREETASFLNQSARVIKLGIADLVNGCPPDKVGLINQQISLASSHLAKYIGWDVVYKFIAEETLETGRMVSSHGS